MTLENEFKLLVSGYYGVAEMDDYKLKEYILRDIEKYIQNFVALNPIPNYNYREVAQSICDKSLLKVKLQDSLLVLHKVSGPLELILMIKERLEELK